MANCTSKQNGRVYYVEPNYIGGYQGNSIRQDGDDSTLEGTRDSKVYEMAPPLEDYCVAFQLQVEIPSRVTNSSVNSQSQVYILSVNNESGKQSVSLLQGTRILDDPNNPDESRGVQYLTTAVLESTLKDVRKASPMELFGVKSIDITYESWMTPQVTIQFTDIRGASLFAPEELAHPFNGQYDANQDPDIAGSFFRCFFKTPYPIFALTVKGFYGEATSYELSYANFSFKANSDTGNYDAEAKFVGYTWSLLGDVTFNSLMAAPYDHFYGKQYWKEQIENNRFVVDLDENTTTAMPTIARVIRSYEELTKKQQVLPLHDVEVQRNLEYESQLKYLEENLNLIRNAVSAMYSTFSANSFAIVPITNDDPANGFIAISDVGQGVYGSAQEIQKIIQPHYEILRNLNEKFNYYFAVSGSITKDEKEFKYSKDNNGWIKNIGSIYKNGDDVVFTFNRYFGYEIEKENLIFYSSKLKNVNPTYITGSTTSPQDVYGVVINTKSLISKLEKEYQSGKEEKELNDLEITKKQHQEIAKCIGMAPTVYNVIKVMMAHLETLIHCIYKCEEYILPYLPDQRTIRSTGLDRSEFTQICSEKGTQIQTTESEHPLTPFPEVQIKKTKEGRTIVEDGWLGDLLEDTQLFPEIGLVEGLLKGLEDMYSDVTEAALSSVKNDNGSELLLNVVCPVVPSDLFIPEPIFGALDTDNMADLMGAIALRGTYVLGAIQDNRNNPRVCGRIDAHNLLKKYGNRLSKAWKDSFLGCGGENEFWDLFEKICITKTPIIPAPWQKNDDHSLLNTEDLIPYLPRVEVEESTKFKGYPVYDINFNCEAYTNKVTNEKKYAGYPSRDGFYFNISTDPALYQKVEDIFNSDEVKNIKGIKGIKDNFTPLEKIGRLTKGTFGECFRQGFLSVRDYYFTKTFRAAANLEFDPTSSVGFPTEKNKGDGYTFTLYPSISMYSNWINILKKGQSSFSLNDKGAGTDFFKFFSLTTWTDDPIDTLYYVPKGSNKRVRISKTNFTDVGTFFGDGMTLNGEKITDWYIPTFNGYDLKKNGDEYIINGTTNKTSLFVQAYYLNAKSMEEKAQLFLYVLNQSYDLIDCLAVLLGNISDNGKSGIFKVLPYFFMIYLGGFLKASRYPEEGGFSKKDSVWAPFNSNSNVDALIYCIRLELRETLIEEYKNWVNGTSEKSLFGIPNYISFPKIDAAFGIKNLNALKMISTGDWEKLHAPELVLIDSKYGDSESFLKYYKSFDLERTSGTDKSEGDGYLTNGFYCKLYFREGTEEIQLLSSMYVQPVLLTICQQWPDLSYKDIGYLGEKEGDRAILESYVKGFYEEACSILGYDKLPKDQNGVPISQIGDIDKHIKISMYKYLKQLYDDRLCSQLWRDSEPGDKNHWDLEPFFEDHFHFIDQFYVDCRDIFFNMEGLLKYWKSSFEQTNMTFLSYISNALAECKFALYPVQNFLDYSNSNCERKMNNLFRPISFNEAFSDIPAPHKIYSDFVVLYESQPSSKLDLSEDGCGDSFDASKDPIWLPEPLKEFGGAAQRHNLIPCFGVSYGKQYQSYFKSVQVDTTSPIPTEQATTAQYQIANGASRSGVNDGSNPRQVGCLGQDLYTIYSTQSYTCTVEMMGCMWIQPTMYFALTNLPTFRGTYIIQKVTHSMKQGYMSTTFMGTRMASTSTPHVYNWFLGRSTANPETDKTALEDITGTMASTDNDCPYKVFIPGSSGNLGESGIGGLSINGLLFVLTCEGWAGSETWADYGAKCKSNGDGLYGPGLTPSVSGICGHSVVANTWYNGDQVWEDFIKVTTNYHQKDLSSWGVTPEKFGQSAYDVMIYLHHWLPSGCKYIAENANNGGDVARILRDKSNKNAWSKKNRSWYDQAYAESKSDATATEMINDYAAICEGTTPDKPGFRYKSYMGEASSKLKSFIEGKIGKSTVETNVVGDVDDVTNNLKNLEDSIRKTCEYSSNINIATTYARYDVDKNILRLSVNKDFNVPEEDNITLFDVALNAYYDYYKALAWVVNDSNSSQEAPIYIELYLDDNLQKQIIVAYYNDEGDPIAITENKGINGYHEGFYRSIAKKFLSGESLPNDFFKITSPTFKNFQTMVTDPGRGDLIMKLQGLAPQPCPVGTNSSWNGETLEGLPSGDGFWWVKDQSHRPPND